MSAVMGETELLAMAEAGTLPRALLLPFHSVRVLAWDEAAGTGRIEAVRRNSVDDWFYGCHFLGDPVMPGCWGVDAVWQALRLFAAWRGLPACDKPMGMEGVSFFGQIRPYDKEVVYAVDVLSIERDGGEAMVTGKASVSVDGVPVYTIASAAVGTGYWQDESKSVLGAVPPAPEAAYRAPLSAAEFTGRSAFSHPEIIALSRGTLVKDPAGEMGLLPDSLMLEVRDVRRIAFDEAAGEGEILATRANAPTEWFFPMSGGSKPAALLVDGVWQLLGMFLAWAGNAGTGRALGFERVELFGAVTPKDAELVYKLKILKYFKAPQTGDAFARADAEVFADGRRVLAMANANVGCHKNIRYCDYPVDGVMGRGGKLMVRA
ncbi:MAG: hypothetical protein HYZ75_11995 [Elusimicrobia bacterium]|nr:hypothetical protein [Elusimicrobiota bacterium]